MNRRDFMIAGAATAGWWSVSAALPTWAAASKKGVLNIAVQPEPPGLMLGIIQNGPTQMVSGNIYESLLRYDEKLEPMPNLATSWTVNEGATVYTFKLKEGVLWHDGKPFTAQDVVFSVDVFLRKTHARLRASLAYVSTIKALDDHTVEFTLKEPFGPFMGLFESGTMPMIPRHIYEGTDFMTNPANNTPVGTGPYKFKEWRRGSFIHLVRNDQYHDKQLPNVDTVYFHIIPDAASRAAAFESGKIDVLPGGTVEYFDIERLKALPNVSITTKGWEFFGPHSFMWINNRNGVLKDVKMRQAIMYALNRESMRDIAWQGFGKVATGPFNSSVRYYTDNVTKYKQDIPRAKKLAAEAGYKGETLRLLPLPYGETWQRFAEIVRQNLAAAGIKVDLVATDVAGWNEKVANWDYDLAFTYLYEYGDAALGVSRNYLSTSIEKGSAWNNVEGYSNPKVDDLFKRGAGEPDPEKRRAIYEEVQRIIVDEVPVAWLLELQFPTIYRSNIKNLVNSGIGLNDSLARATIE
ncbi:ABC transporter substrate-binding protein [Schauerella aestuarii]|uniref:ABC transporter substrate-binding protein n=1 Tax=Schauerella aestuarii TaxID=2511204 RepID=UPI00136F85F0|nr:ABC transporter substrate-binding protein [Achromobacter aestuarii]MYZ41593.1 ABC transporter substrate-binding protein [Achromobacter aestuarii]